MTGPLAGSFSIPEFIIVSLVLGFFFGFFLERAGFSSALKLTAQFYFRDFAVLKVMFTAIIVAMVGIGYLSYLGWLDMSRVFVPATLVWPQLVGGLLLGAGFIVGGYCPGTSAVAAATGKLDALFFVGGIFVGIFLFGVTLPGFEGFNSSGSLGALTLPQWLNVNTGIVILAIVVVAVAAFWAAEMSEGPWKTFARTYGPFARQEGDKES
ncbi:MAG: YeeE/YedE family protein [Acidobacteriota bacterium]|nr:YeeE/YedE family protein [Acidobacteriota bacterium]